MYGVNIYKFGLSKCVHIRNNGTQGFLYFKKTGEPDHMPSLKTHSVFDCLNSMNKSRRQLVTLITE